MSGGPIFIDRSLAADDVASSPITLGASSSEPVPDIPSEPEPTVPARPRPGAIAIAAILAAITAAVLWNMWPDAVAVEEPVVTTTTEPPAPPALSVDVYRQVAPSLVFIETTGADPDLNGIGSGVIVNADGLIMTSLHVVESADTIEVTFADGVAASATIVEEIPENDLALLIADASPNVIVPAVLGGVGRLQVGDEAYAVGNPLGLRSSLSAGVVSALGRTIPLPGGGVLEELIQFDTAVNPGNSGGPLLDRDGVVVGIVTALVSPSEDPGFSGIGFAVTFCGGVGGDDIGPGQ